MIEFRLRSSDEPLFDEAVSASHRALIDRGGTDGTCLLTERCD